MSGRPSFPYSLPEQRLLAPALKLMIASAVPVLVFSPVHAQEWAGAVSDSWSLGANWGTGTIPTGNQDVIINSTSPNIAIASGVTYLVPSPRLGSDHLRVGQLTGSTGTLILEDNSNFTIGTMFLGESGTGHLTLRDSQISTGIVFIGNNSQGEGSLTVDGPDASFNSRGNRYVVVGSYGQGSLDILNGGTVTSYDGYIGDNPGGSGSVLVSGAGSIWEIGHIFGVGGDGDATVIIEDGGTITVGGIFAIGPAATSSSSVTVSGTGSSLLASTADFAISYDGEGVLNVLDGGLVSTSNISMATNAGSSALLSLGGDPSARGMVMASGITKGAGAASIVFDGGILQATQDNGDFLSGFVSGDVQVLSQGAYIDTGVRDIGISAVMAGDGDLVKLGAGTLTLSAANAYGNTRVEQGSLFGSVGSISGNIHLNGAATALVFTDIGGAFYDREISGNGTVSSTGPAITIADGGSIAPGNNGIGTLTVDGDLRFETGSRLVVEVNPAGTESDLVAVTGDVTLNGGAVVHIGATGEYDLHSTYTILAADGTLSGAFEGVSSDFAFLTPNLIYDYAVGKVDLGLLRNDRDFASAAQTRNQIATAEGIESIGFSAGNAVYDAIAQLPGDEDLIRTSFDALSGEIHASTKAALIEDSRFIRNAANDRMRAAFTTPGASHAPVLAFAADYTPTAVVSDHIGPAFWSHGFGSWGSTDSNGNAAALDRDTGGLLIGSDSLVGDWRVGLLAGFSHSSFKANDRASSASSDNYHLGIYGGRQWGNLALRTGAAYSWHNIETNRDVSIPGLSENLSANYRARTFQAFGELAQGFDVNTATRLEPFANLAHIRLHSNGFTERGGAAALSSASDSTNMTFTTLGLRGEHKLALGTGDAILRGMIGWRHAFGDTTPESSHAFSAGDGFTIAGVPIARNSALIEAGIDFNLTPNSTFSLSYAGQLASGARDHGIKANFAMRF